MKSVSSFRPARRCLPLVLFGTMAFCGPSLASSTVTVNVKVSVITSPCTINDGKSISVEFGNSIHQADIEAGKYSVQVPYTIDCGTEQNLTFTMTLQGTAADFNSNYLATDKTGLGISLSTSDNAAILNNPITFAEGKAPAIMATLVSQDNVAQETGEFSATATLKLSYQ